MSSLQDVPAMAALVDQQPHHDVLVDSTESVQGRVMVYGPDRGHPARPGPYRKRHTDDGDVEQLERENSDLRQQLSQQVATHAGMNHEIELLASNSAEKDEHIELLTQRLEAANLYAEDSERTAISQSAQVAHVVNIASRETDVAQELRLSLIHI